MRWLWRKERTQQTAGKTSDDLAGDMTLNKILVPGKGWTQFWPRKSMISKAG